MKYIFTLLVFISLSYSAHSQLWFDAGLKGAWGATLMYDNNVFDSGTYKHKITPGTAIGGRLGINFGYHAGISLEYQGATSKQDFEHFSKVLNTFKWKHNDVLALFRWSGNGGYIEIGGEFSHIKDVSLIKRLPQESTIDVTNKFEKSYKSGVFGFGSYLMGGGLFTANLGVRFHWSIDDMVNGAGKEARIPFTAEVNESYDPSKKTLATAAQLQLELNYAFGRFAKSACHDKWRLLLFQ